MRVIYIYIRAPSDLFWFYLHHIYSDLHGKPDEQKAKFDKFQKHEALEALNDATCHLLDRSSIQVPLQQCRFFI